MSDLADLGQEKAHYIEQALIDRGITTTNVYAVAYCSDDGTPTVEVFAGSKAERFAFMESRGIDPVVSDDWAIAQWNRSAQTWGKILPGNGEMEQFLHGWLLGHKPATHLRS